MERMDDEYIFLAWNSVHIRTRIFFSNSFHGREIPACVLFTINRLFPISPVICWGEKKPTMLIVQTCLVLFLLSSLVLCYVQPNQFFLFVLILGRALSVLLSVCLKAEKIWRRHEVHILIFFSVCLFLCCLYSWVNNKTKAIVVHSLISAPCMQYVYKVYSFLMVIANIWSCCFSSDLSN